MPVATGDQDRKKSDRWLWVMMIVPVSAILALLLLAPALNIGFSLGPRVSVWATSKHTIPAWRQGPNTNTGGDSRNWGVRLGNWSWGVTHYEFTP